MGDLAADKSQLRREIMLLEQTKETLKNESVSWWRYGADWLNSTVRLFALIIKLLLVDWLLRQVPKDRSAPASPRVQNEELRIKPAEAQ